MPDLSWLTNLIQNPINIGVLIGIAALLLFGKNAPAKPLLTWMTKLIPRGTSPPPAEHEHDCQAALLCIMNHATRSGKTELVAKLLELIVPINEMHDEQMQGHSVATRISE